MASFTITESKKGVLQAKIQVNGKDAETGKRKTFVKRIYNTDGLTEAKFRKQAEKLSIAFEEEIAAAYQQATTDVRSRILTFSELMAEWKAHIKANLSINYLERAEAKAVKEKSATKSVTLITKGIFAFALNNLSAFPAYCSSQSSTFSLLIPL